MKGDRAMRLGRGCSPSEGLRGWWSAPVDIAGEFWRDLAANPRRWPLAKLVSAATLALAAFCSVAHADDSATITNLTASPLAVAAGDRIDFSFTVTNVGTTTWDPIGTTFVPYATPEGPIPYPNEYGTYYAWIVFFNLDAPDPFAVPLYMVVPLPTVLSPGQSATIDSFCYSPPDAGHWAASFLLVKYFVHGFYSGIMSSPQQVFDECPRFEFDVNPGTDDSATITDLTASPLAVAAGERIDFSFTVTNVGTTTWEPIGTTFSPYPTPQGPIVYPNEYGTYYIEIEFFNLDAPDPFAVPLIMVVPLPTVLSPGQSATIDSYCYAPSDGGHWAATLHPVIVFEYGFYGGILNSPEQAFYVCPRFEFDVDNVFVDGFESGDTSAWSATVP